MASKEPGAVGPPGGGGGKKKGNRRPRGPKKAPGEGETAGGEEGSGATSKPQRQRKPKPGPKGAAPQKGGGEDRPPQPPPNNKKEDGGTGAAKGNRRKKGKGSNAAAEKKRKQEEEERKRREEEEAKRIAAEEKRKRIEERQRLQREVDDRVTKQIAALNTLSSVSKQRADSRRTLGNEESLQALRKAHIQNKKSLKSDLKKCTTFVKKVKGLGGGGAAGSSGPTVKPDEAQQLLKDCISLNLTRYVEELARALITSLTSDGSTGNTKLRPADLPLIISLCAAMHERYADFLPSLVPSLWEVVASSSNHKPQSRRLCLRLITEFALNGIITETKSLLKIVGEAAGLGPGSTDGALPTVTDPALLVAFCKAAGHELLAIVPRSIRGDLQNLVEEIEKQKSATAANTTIDRTAESAPTEASDEAPNDIDTPTQPSTTETKVGSGSEEITTTFEMDNATEEENKPIVISKELADASEKAVEAANLALGELAVSVAVSDTFKANCLAAHRGLCKSLLVTHSKLQKLEKRCEQDRLLAGSLTEAREKGLLDARKLLEQLSKSVESLSETLDQDAPELKDEEDEAANADNANVGVELWTDNNDNEDGQAQHLGPFDDEEARSFYSDLPDLLTTIPPALLGLTQDDVLRIQAENQIRYGASENDDAAAASVLLDDPEDASEAVNIGDDSYGGNDATEDNLPASEGKDDTDAANKDTPHYKLTVLIEQELPDCNRRETVDELAEKFCANHGASKTSRKRLSKTLFLVPRTRLDLLPYYSRLAAILDRIFSDVAAPMVKELENQFHGLARFKKNVNLENRLKNARYLGELTKFRVAPPIVVLRCLQRCLGDFTGYNIDVACCLLESCGRYLYRTPHTKARITSLMETMMRIRKARNLDERSVALINSAFYMVNPPASAARKQAKVLPPLEAYMKYLLMVRLEPQPGTISFISKQLMRLPWSEPAEECGAKVVKYMLKACRKGRYKSIGSVAGVASNMRRSKPEVSARLIDTVLEELQWSMEHPNFRDQQRTIVHARLLGELHCSSLVSSSIIIDQLYHFINFGHEIPPALHEASGDDAGGDMDSATTGKSTRATFKPSISGVTQTIREDEEMDDDDEASNASEDPAPPPPEPVAVSLHSKFDPRVTSVLDPSSAVFRIKLVITLLDSVMPVIVTKNNLPKLNNFIAAFQRYLFTKPILPSEIEFALLDVFDALQSKWKTADRGDGGRGAGRGKDNRNHIDYIRYSNWLEAHNATVAVEEAESLVQARAQTRLEVLGGLHASNAGDGASVGASVDLEGDDLDHELSDDESMDDALSFQSHGRSDSDLESDEEDGSDAESYSGDESGAEMSVDREESDGSNESDESDEESYAEEEEEIDEAAAHEAYMRQLEEEAFERELRRLTMDALEKGKAAARTGTGGKVADTMVSASQFEGKKSSNDAGGNSNTTPGHALGGGAGVSFKLLKRGHKGRVEAKELVVPTGTNLAILATKQDDEKAKERDMLKARVLQYEAESAEQQHTGGNVYMDQTKLQVIRNRPLSMEDIDRNFGINNHRPSHTQGRGGGRDFGRGRGRGHGGRRLV